MSYASQSVKRALLLLLMVAASAAIALATHAATAHATNVEGYECGNCASVNGGEKNIAAPGFKGAVNAYAKNLSGTGVCSKAWIHGSEWHEFAKCTASPGYELFAFGELTCPIGCTGHGQALRYYQQFTYNLYGYEEWS